MGYLDGDPYSADDFAADMAECDRWQDTVSKLGPYAQTSQQIIGTVETLAWAQAQTGGQYENSWHEAYAARVDHMAEQYGPPNHELRY